MTVPFGFSWRLGGSTFVGTVPLFAAVEAESFLDASGMICRRELSETDCVDVHGVRVFG